jgi:hypothetical protein
MNLVLQRTKGKMLILVMHGSEEYHKRFDRIIKIGLPSDTGGKHHENSLVV